MKTLSEKAFGHDKRYNPLGGDIVDPKRFKPTRADVTRLMVKIKTGCGLDKPCSNSPQAGFDSAPSNFGKWYMEDFGDLSRKGFEGIQKGLNWMFGR
jgi:hypothetical protein